MVVETIMTSGGDTSVGKIETDPVTLQSKTARKASERKESVSRSVQQQQHELGNELSATVDKQQEKMKAQAGQVLNAAMKRRE